MYTEKSVVKCESGLHNRQATFFIQKANEFRSSIWIEVDDRKINAKSLLGVLSMAITTVLVTSINTAHSAIIPFFMDMTERQTCIHKYPPVFTSVKRMSCTVVLLLVMVSRICFLRTDRSSGIASIT